jgi:hypothetical protein
MRDNFSDLAGILHEQENHPKQKSDGNQGFQYSWLLPTNWLWNINIWLYSPLFVPQFRRIIDLLGNSPNRFMDLVVRTLQEFDARI